MEISGLSPLMKAGIIREKEKLWQILDEKRILSSWSGFFV